MKNEINTKIGAIRLYRNLSSFLGLSSSVITGINIATYSLTSDVNALYLAGVGTVITGLAITSTINLNKKIKILKNPKVLDFESYRK